MEALGAESDDLTPPHTGVRHGNDHCEVGVVAGQGRASLGDQQCLDRRRPHLRGLLDALYAPLPLAALAPSALTWIGLDIARDGVAEDCRQGGPRVTGCPPGIPSGRDLPLPGTYFLRRDGGQSAVPERRKDMYLDLVPVIAQSCRLQVQSWVPLVDPLGKRDLSRARIDIGVGADGGFLVTTVVLGGLTRVEAGSGLQRAVRPPPACAPQVPPFLRVGHRISRSAVRALSCPVRPPYAGHCAAGAAAAAIRGLLRVVLR